MKLWLSAALALAPPIVAGASMAPVHEAEARSLAVVRHIDLFLAQPDAVGLSNLIGAAALKAGPPAQIHAPLAVLAYLRQPERLRALRAQAELPEAFRLKLDALAAAGAALAEKARLAAEAGRPELSRLLGEADEHIRPFITSGRIDIAGEGLERLFSGEGHGDAVLAVEGKGLGPLPAHKAIAVSEKKPSSASSRFADRRLLPSLTTKPEELATVAATIKELARSAGPEEGAALRRALDFLADSIETRRYSPEVGRLAFEDAELRRSLTRIADGRVRPDWERLEELGARFPSAKPYPSYFQSPEREQGLGAARAFIEEAPPGSLSFVAPSEGSTFSRVLAAQVQGTGEASDRARLKVALHLASYFSRTVNTPREPPLGDQAARFIVDFLERNGVLESRAPRALVLLERIVPSSAVIEAAASRKERMLNAALEGGLAAAGAAFIALALWLAPHLPIGVYWRFILTGGAAILGALGMAAWGMRARRAEQAALQATGRRYLDEVRRLEDVGSEQKKLSADYRAELRRVVAADGRAAWLLGELGGDATYSGEPGLDPVAPFAVGMANLLQRPEPIRGRAWWLLKRKLKLDAERVGLDNNEESIAQLAADAALLKFVLPHIGPKDLKQSVAAVVMELLKSEHIGDAEGLLRAMLPHWDERLAAGLPHGEGT